MNPYRYIVSLLLFAACCSGAAEPSKSDMIRELMRIQGLHEMIDQAKAASEAQVLQTTEALRQELKTKFSMLPPAFMSEMLGALDRYTKSANGGWTTSEAVAEWERLYGSELSAEDVTKVLEFYKSPVGQKDIAATKAAVPKWGAFFTQRSTDTMNRAMKAYVAEVEQIVARATKR